jgi:hypothetical protein
MLRVRSIRKIDSRKRLTGEICSGKSRFLADGRELLEAVQKMRMDGEQREISRALTSAAMGWVD